MQVANCLQLMSCHK